MGMVNIYCGSQSDIVFSISMLELSAKSKVMRNILGSMSVCDGCREPVSIIFAEEDRETVQCVMNQIAHFNKTGVSIIQGVVKLKLHINIQSLLNYYDCRSREG